MLQPTFNHGEAPSGVFPVDIKYSALIESGIALSNAVAADCTIALGFKPTGTPTAPLVDQTSHYLLTIQKQGTTVKVWKQGVPLVNFTGIIGANYGEFLANVLTAYAGSTKGYYSRLVIVEAVKTYADFWEQADIVTGLWRPKSIAGLVYGVGGGLYEFGNAASLGTDTSGNGNDATVSGTQTLDTPTNNYCTLNPLVGLGYSTDVAAIYSGGNLEVSGSSASLNTRLVNGTLPASGLLYFEDTFGGRSAAGRWFVGLRNADEYALNFPGVDSNSIVYTDNGYILYNNTFVVSGLTTPTVNDVVQVAYNTDTGELWIGLNGTWLNSGDPETGTNPIYTQTLGVRVLPSVKATLTADVHTLNFGATGFTYTPPTDFLALCSNNLPDPIVMKSAQAAQIVLRQGTGAAVDVLTPGMEGGPDWVNIKSRSNTRSWNMYDIVRGNEKAIFTDLINAESVKPGSVSFDGVGYQLGNQSLCNFLSESYIDFCLKAGVDHGFEIVKYTGDGVAGRQIAHTLGRAPTFMIVRRTNDVSNWLVYHKDLGATKYLVLNKDSASGASAIYWNNTEPTSTGFTVGADPSVNRATDEYIAYLFTDSDIFKAFSYIGNGLVDGPFVNLGGKLLSVPFWKDTQLGTTDWLNYDAARNPFNPWNTFLRPNLPDVESSSLPWLYATSNGFKVITNGQNTNGNLIVGLAILESTKHSNAF